MDTTAAATLAHPDRQRSDDTIGDQSGNEPGRDAQSSMTLLLQAALTLLVPLVIIITAQFANHPDVFTTDTLLGGVWECLFSSGLFIVLAVIFVGPIFGILYFGLLATHAFISYVCMQERWPGKSPLRRVSYFFLAFAFASWWCSYNLYLLAAAWL